MLMDLVLTAAILVSIKINVKPKGAVGSLVQVLGVSTRMPSHPLLAPLLLLVLATVLATQTNNVFVARPI